MNILAQEHLTDGLQSEIAKSLGISQPYLSSLLSGRKRPSLELAVRIEQATGGKVPASSWITARQELNQNVGG